MDQQEVIASEEVLLNKLRNQYWNGATRDVCNMILSYRELSESTSASRRQAIDDSDLDT